MGEFSSRSRSGKQPVIRTPQWAMDRIRKIKAKYQNALDLSLPWLSELEKLTELPDEVFDFTWLNTLKLRRNLFKTVSGSITKLQKLTTLDLKYNQLSLVPKPITNLENLRS